MIKTWTGFRKSALLSAVSVALCTLAACDQSDVSSGHVHRSPLIQSTLIRSIAHTQGAAATRIVNTFDDQAQIVQGSFTIGQSIEDAAACKAANGRETTHADGSPCTIMNDLADVVTTPGSCDSPGSPAYEDTTVIEVTVDVGSAKTLKWKWNFQAWEDEHISAFTMDVVHDGTTEHVIRPVHAPAYWGWWADLASGEGLWTSGPLANGLDLTRWENQTIVVRFIVRNTNDPTHWGYAYDERYGCDFWTGHFDPGMGKLTVTELYLDDKCPVGLAHPLVDPLAIEIEEGEHSGNPVRIIDRLSPQLQIALSCLEDAMTGAGGAVDLQSAWRPQSYQWHLRDIVDADIALDSITDEACDDFRAMIADEVRIHGLGNRMAAKGNEGQHPNGNAIDIKSSLGYAHDVPQACACGLFRPYYPGYTDAKGKVHERGDPPHYELIRNGASCH